MANPENLKPFVKGDPRCWRKGRPKEFNTFRAMLKEIGNEIARDKTGEPIIIDRGLPTEHIATNVEMLGRSWLKDPRNQEKFTHYAYGKVPDKLEVETNTIKVKLVNDDSRD